MRHPRLRGKDFARTMACRVSVNHYRINEIETGRGAVLLPNIGWANAVSDDNYVPLHIYSLDKRLTDATDFSVLGWQCYHARDIAANTERYDFTPNMWYKSIKDGDVANNDNYVSGSCSSSLWQSDQTAALRMSEKNKWYQKRAMVELVMYGQTNADTLYRVDVVRLDPRHSALFSSSGVITPPATTSTEWSTLWHSLVAPYTQNPLHKPAKAKGALTIVKSYKFKIPEQSADFDRIPCVKTKINIPLDRVLNYRWKIGVDGTTSTNLIDPEDDTIMNDEKADNSDTAQQDNNFPAPEYRYFLMIRASNTDRGANLGAFPSTFAVARGQDPTYDIKMRLEYLVDI